VEKGKMRPMQGTAHKPWDEKHAVSSEYQMTKFNSSNTSSRIGNGKKKMEWREVTAQDC